LPPCVCAPHGPISSRPSQDRRPPIDEDAAMRVPTDRRGFLASGIAYGLGLGFAGARPARAGSGESRCRPALLPQDDPDPDGRLKRLERTRRRYTYDYTRVPSLPMVGKAPASEPFSRPWLAQALARVADVVENFISRPGGAREDRARAWRRAVEAARAPADGRTAESLVRLAQETAAAAARGGRP